MQIFRFNYTPSIILAFAGAMLPWGMASAATDTDTFDVTVTVIAACGISATDHDFGTYDALSPSPLDSTSTISVTCTSGASYSVALNAGTTGGGTIPARLMTDGANTISYNLYTNSGYGTVWGDGTGGSSDVTGTGSGSVQDLTVYGRMPAGQGEPAGAYSDTVTATITY
jgi:spore coat protein U-like protein